MPNTKDIIKKTTVIINGFSALIIASILIFSGTPHHTISDYLFEISVILYNVLPYLIFMFYAKKAQRMEVIIKLLICAIVSGFLGIYCLYEGLYNNADAQAGLIVLFLPMFLIPIAIVLYMLMSTIRWITRIVMRQKN